MRVSLSTAKPLAFQPGTAAARQPHPAAPPIFLRLPR